MTAPVTGETVEVGIERIAYGGEGVGRADGLVIFVPGTAPGDRVRTRIVERHPRFARGRLEAVVDAGPGRVSPGCSVYGTCGGCQLQHLEREAQLESKARAVTDALERIAGRAVPEGLRCEPASRPWHWRRRATFSWRRRSNRVTLGFHAAADPADLVDLHACPILAEPANRVLSGLRRGLEALPRAEPEEGRLAIRCLPGIEPQAGVFVTAPDRARALAEACADAAGIHVTWGTRGGRWGPLELAVGAPRLAARVEIGGLSLRVGFDSFLQADPESAARLYETALAGLSVRSGDRVVDGYAGVGALACRLAREGVEVTAVEAHPGAASDLRANAAATAGAGVHVLELPAERVDWSRPRPTAVIVNPPRAGCAQSVIASIGRSSARRLVYVSCDPSTLARDLRRLGSGWRLESIRAFDLFPQTAHVETVVTLARERAR